MLFVFCFQAEDGIRYLVRSRGLGDVYKRQAMIRVICRHVDGSVEVNAPVDTLPVLLANAANAVCLLYTSDAADERSSVDLGGRRIIQKKNT